MPAKPQGLPKDKKSGEAARIRKDAEAQFEPKKHGGGNSGLDSAAPVATTGDGDATFDNDPEDEAGDGDR